MTSLTETKQRSCGRQLPLDLCGFEDLQGVWVLASLHFWKLNQYFVRFCNRSMPKRSAFFSSRCSFLACSGFEFGLLLETHDYDLLKAFRID